VAAPRGPLGQRAQRLTALIVTRTALSYVGRWTYSYGGPPPPDGDCSSFITTVLHQSGAQIPGPGRWGGPGYPPDAHGPVVITYAGWDGATTVSTPQAGDLCCWVGEGTAGHIGIAVSDTEMVSALDPQQGVARTPITGTGPAQSPLIYRRLNGLAGGTIPATLTGTGPAHPPLAVAAVVAGMYLGAAALAVGAVTLLAAGALRMTRGALA
jgi:NlpC/P60 family